MIRAVLLDLDDTITDRAATVAAYTQQFVRDFGERLRLTDAATIAAELVRIDRNGYNRARASDIAAHGAWTTSPGAEALAEHWNHYFAVCSQGRPGLIDVVDALARAGLKLGVVTNGPTDKQRRKIEVLQLAERVGTVVISEERGFAKPDPRMFHAAAAELGVQSNECVFVGDNPEKDVLGAQRVGMRAVWFRGRIPWPDGLEPPLESIASLRELLDRLDLGDKNAANAAVTPAGPKRSQGRA